MVYLKICNDMISAELILDTRRLGNKGFPVKIRVYDDLEKLQSPHKYISLKIYQPGPELILNSKLRKRISDLDKEVEFCNDNLYRLNEAVNLIINGIPEDDIDIEIALLEKRLELLRKKKGVQYSIGLIKFGYQLIEERKIIEKPILAYENTLKAVAKFLFPTEDIALNLINKEWINSFDLYLKQNKLKDSTIYTYISMVRAIFKEAQSRESLHIKKDNPFLNLRVYKTEKVSVELTIDDLIKIKNLPLENIQTKSYLGQLGIKQLADIYLFQFAIGGHDLIDVANLKWSNIKNGRVKFKRYKNRFKKSTGEEVDNMLNEFALSIIEKYGDKKNDRIFTFLSDPISNESGYKQQVMQFNRYGYKIIAQHIGSKNVFKTKSTRYLFRTEGGNLLIDTYLMMKLQGHTPAGITFGYQGALNYDVQDREHQKILDLVFK